MKLTSPTEQHSEQDISVASLNLEEELQTRSCARTISLLKEINSLAETNSVAETLELTAQLLAQVEIAVTSLSLDRCGSITSWKPSQPTALEPESSGRDSSITVQADSFALEAHYRGEVNALTKRAAGAILKAAVIQTERCSRRVWQFVPAEGSNNTDQPADGCQAGTLAPPLSEKARQLHADIERVARLPYSILITGETGTGKTMTAREIHRRSARGTRPFMELNCANLSEQLVEAELFGYRKGAFTGADRDHKGLFEEADGGTLFLDEIGDIPVAVQNKLLKAIDEKQIKRLGTNRFVSCDVQIIAATSRDLRAMIREGSFREDLYCRLAVLKIEIAPLRERREEIPALIDLFMREAAETVSRLLGRKEEYRIEAGAVELMCLAQWSGNVRVLRNTIYELTSFVSEGAPITIEQVQNALGQLGAREQSVIFPSESRRNALASSPSLNSQDSFTMEGIVEALRAHAQEGDIVLPAEVCILRRGETLKQWAARIKQLGIEATCRTNGTGTMREAATRLGISHGSLKGHLYRARSAS